MIAVVSQAWTKNDRAALDGYLADYERFLALHQTVPGFRSRQLLVGIDDPTHVTNIRCFDELADYEAMIQLDDYAAHIDALSAHLDLTRTPVKEYVRVAVADGPSPR